MTADRAPQGRQGDGAPRSTAASAAPVMSELTGAPMSMDDFWKIIESARAAADAGAGPLHETMADQLASHSRVDAAEAGETVGAAEERSCRRRWRPGTVSFRP